MTDATPGLTRSFVLLRPLAQPSQPQPVTLRLTYDPLQLREDLIQLVERAQGRPIHLDFETTGLDAADPRQSAVGLGLATDGFVVYFDIRAWHPNDWAALALALSYTGWIAWNSPFDGAWLARYTGAAYPPCRGCSQNLFRLLTTEGWPSQGWSLEAGVSGVLGWTYNQKHSLGEMLVRHKLTTHTGTPDKGMMWRLADLEPEGFGRYCGEDADGSWQVWRALEPQARAHPQLWQYVTEEWPVMIELLVEQYLAGVSVDRAGLWRCRAQLHRDIERAEAELRSHPRLATHVEAWEAQAATEFFAPNIAYRRHKADVDTEVRLNGEGPPVDRLDPDGTLWKFFASKSRSLKPWQRPPEGPGGYWYREEPVFTPRNQDRPAPRVNWSSDHWIRWLLYTCLYRWAKLPPDDRGRWKIRVSLEGDDYVDVPPTDGGQPPTGKEILPALGDLGQMITVYNQLTKRLEYVESYLGASERTATIHPKFRAPGTLTGRLSAGGDR